VEFTHRECCLSPRAQQLNVSRTAVYDKLNGVTEILRTLKETAAAMHIFNRVYWSISPKLLAPYKVRIIDGIV
jgi:predicted DNA-binding protein YlxM (UPF0122 family)